MSLTSQPTPRQVLNGVRNSLRAEVLPALQGEQASIARSRLTMALNMLTWVAEQWDASAALLVAEIGALERLLEESLPSLEAAGRSSLAVHLGALAAARCDTLLLSDLIKRSDALQAALLELARLVTADERPEEMSGLRERVLRELTAFNERRRGQGL